MTPIARRQYAFAVLAGLALVGLQGYQLTKYYLAPDGQAGLRVDVPSVAATLQSSLAASAVIVSGYILILIIAHVAPLVMVTWAYRRATEGFRPHWRDRTKGVLVVWFATALLATLWNRTLFPHSLVFPDSDLLLMQPASPLMLWGLSIGMCLIGCLALVQSARRQPTGTISCIAGAGILLALPLLPHSAAMRRGSDVAAPDVIIIGVDSLRPDFLPINGFPNSTLTPTLNRLLDQSVVFSDTITPLARTFVAYVSLLTGQYPIRHGARDNLYPRERFDRSRLLPHRFRESGYATYYATDESRFANIDESFGFDAAITPPVGALDFLLGSVYDSVATNLMALTGATRWLAPHVYGNRAAHRIYRADQFSLRLSSLVASFPASKPVFLVSHFCFPHWPYKPEPDVTNDSLLMASVTGSYYAQAPAAYLRALKEVDTQIDRLMRDLQMAGRLENAIVVLLSDHGEALGMQHDRIESLDESHKLPAYQGYSHGNFTIDPSQYRVVLSLQRFQKGKPLWIAGRNRTPASLIDIAPTLLDAANIPARPEDFDGQSLLSPRQANSPDRLRFVEAGTTGATVDTKAVDERAVAKEFADLYHITAKLRLEIVPSQLDSLLSAKQRGVYGKNHALSTSPSAGCWILSDFRARTMRCLDAPQNDAIAQPMYEATCTHFSSDPGFLQRWCPDYAVGLPDAAVSPRISDARHNKDQRAAGLAQNLH